MTDVTFTNFRISDLAKKQSVAECFFLQTMKISTEYNTPLFSCEVEKTFETEDDFIGPDDNDILPDIEKYSLENEHDFIGDHLYKKKDSDDKN